MIHPLTQSINLPPGLRIFGTMLLLPVISVTAQQTNPNQKSVVVAPGDEKTVGFATENPGDTYQLDVTPGGGKKFQTTGNGDNILGENSDGALWQRVTNTEQLKRFKVTSANIHQGHDALFNLEFKKNGGGGGGGGPLADAYVKAVNCFVKIHTPGTIAAPGTLIPAPTQAGKPYTGILQRNTDDEIAAGVEDCASASKTGTGLTADNDLVKVELSWNPATLKPGMMKGKTLTLTLPVGAKAYRDDGSLLTQFSTTIGSGGSDQLSQLASARKQNIFLEGNGTWNGGDIILKVDGLDNPGAQGKANLVPVIFVTPAGNPVSSPSAQGDGQNEFTYDDQSPGVLTITLKATVQNYDYLPNDIKNGLVFDFKKDANNQVIGTSSLAWVGSQGGKPTVNGSVLTATGKFTTLPTQNDAFGKKWVQIKLGGIEIAKEDFEVFFMKDENNHPELGPYPGPRPPNWYYYWRQALGYNGIEYHGGGRLYGETPGMLQWSYTVAPLKDVVYVYDLASTVDPGDASADHGQHQTTGIDVFVDTVLHEKKHVDQIDLADALVSMNPGTPWQYGWSWNKVHNHWAVGPDAQPGEAGVDDDGDMTVDNLIATGPGELGGIHDVRLDDGTTDEWPPSLGTKPPPPWAGGSPVEDQAYNVEPDVENAKAGLDWGNPGKQHQTINKYND